MEPGATDRMQDPVRELVPNREMESGTESYFAAERAFQRAVSTRPDLLGESYYRFGGQPVRMRVVGRTLAQRLADAFAHLKTAPLNGQTAQLTIDLWDETESGVPRPPSFAQVQSDLTWKTGGGFVTGYAGGRLLYYQQAAGATWFDRRARHMVGWRALSATPATSEHSKLLPLLLSIWYYDRDVHTTHAALVGLNGNGVLIGGPSGAGKSTTALTCVLDGFDYLGDDHIGLSANVDGSFVGYSLYNGARLAPDLLVQLSALKPYAIPSNSLKDDKFLIFLSQIFPSQITRAVTVRAIVLPRISQIERSRVRRATKREAMLQLAPTSFFTPFSSGARGFERLGQLVDRVPLYWLDMSERLNEIPPLVREILKGAMVG